MKHLFCLLSLLFAQVVLAVNPIKEYVDTPANSKFRYEEVQIETADGYALQSWTIYPDDANRLNRTLILAYSDAGNMSYWLRQGIEIVNQGYTVVMFDYRGFGASDAFEMEEDMLYYDEFAIDLQAVVAYAKEKFNTKIGVWALSMGTISAVITHNVQPYDYLIADGFVVDPKIIIERLYHFLEKEIHLPPGANAYDKALTRLTLPVLFIVGDRDGLTTMQDSHRVKPLNPKSEVVAYKGGHLQGFQAMTKTYHGEGYIDAINAFYTKTFEK
ncbi:MULTISPECIES: alpha/beta hydrolase [unclassified Myroides]|uniref:alpha/beta hydrolase n=1 Tax=unclassified Myroides TaxID=2642485 RepID=UPI0015F865F1|nr:MULTISPECIES: alpha/beta hydrolase [unclassified Myroides]MBB1150278.1 alpha/beta hydrolase [Myroides sp. NP-2]MDM1408602.1 alpha/beta hydrolase [Myroides sp. DF42-4-2]